MALVLAYLIGLILGTAGASTCSFAPLYPYGTDRGDTNVTSGDDDYYKIEFGHTIDFYGSEYDSLYVSLNGVVSFMKPMTRSSTVLEPIPFPVFSPYWADVLLKDDGGGLYYRNVNLIAEKDVADFVEKDSTAIGAALKPDLVFVFTWKTVKKFKGDPLVNNTFQAVLASDGKKTVIIYNYGCIAWNGTDEYAGVLFDKGDRITRVSYAISATPEVINIADYSNIGFPGRIVTRVDGDIQLIPLISYTCPSCVIDRSSGNVTTFDGSTELNMGSPDQKYMVSKEYMADAIGRNDPCKYSLKVTTNTSGSIDWLGLAVGVKLKRNIAFSRTDSDGIQIRGRGQKVIEGSPYYEYIVEGDQTMAVMVEKTPAGWMVHSPTCQYQLVYNPLDEVNQLRITVGPYFEGRTFGMCQNDNGDVGDDRMLCVVPPVEADGDDFADQVSESCSCPRSNKSCSHILTRM